MAKAPAANFDAAATPEVWAEIDRLRAVNADLLAALKQISSVDASVHDKRYRLFTTVTADMAINKAESA